MIDTYICSAALLQLTLHNIISANLLQNWQGADISADGIQQGQRLKQRSQITSICLDRVYMISTAFDFCRIIAIGQVYKNKWVAKM